MFDLSLLDLSTHVAQSSGGIRSTHSRAFESTPDESGIEGTHSPLRQYRSHQFAQLRIHA
jgi:hypothetical protein